LAPTRSSWSSRLSLHDALPIYLCGATVDALCGACHPDCDHDSDCPSGEVCGLGAGAYVGRIGENACWPVICETEQQNHCGLLSSDCGECACQPNCSGKACGDDASDGCGGACTSFCGARDTGCERNSDCPVGYTCMQAQASRIGGPEDTNVCLPETCAAPIPDLTTCGSEADECGLCPTCENACDGRECGPDINGCNVDCGTCAEGLTCSAGQCIEVAAKVIEVPDDEGGELTIESIDIPLEQTSE